MMAMPLPKLPGTMAAAVSSTRGAKPLFRRIPISGGGLPSPVPGITSRAAMSPGFPLLATTSFSSSSGTAKSNSGASSMGCSHYP